MIPPWLEELFGDVTLLQGVLWGALIAAAATAIYKGWPWLKRLVVLVDALGALPEYMERIRHQVENDHDTNLRDEVSELLELASQLATQFAQLADWRVAHEERSDAVVARIERLEEKVT